MGVRCVQEGTIRTVRTPSQHSQLITLCFSAGTARGNGRAQDWRTTSSTRGLFYVIHQTRRWRGWGGERRGRGGNDLRPRSSADNGKPISTRSERQPLTVSPGLQEESHRIFRAQNVSAWKQGMQRAALPGGRVLGPARRAQCGSRREEAEGSELERCHCVHFHE